MIEYQYVSPDGFPPNLGGLVLINNPNIDNIYVDGVSITYGNNPCKQVWTLGVGVVANNINHFFVLCVILIIQEQLYQVLLVVIITVNQE